MTSARPSPPAPVVIAWSSAPRRIRRVIVTDRDGVLGDVDSRRADHEAVQLHRACRDAVRAVHEAGYAIVVVSNQGDVERGAISLERMLHLNEVLLSRIDPGREYIDYVVLCPHRPETGCRCRKPRPGGVRAIERCTGELVTEGWFVGDQRIDLECGRALGLRTALVHTGHGGATADALGASSELAVLADLCAEDFAAAVALILG